MLNLLARVFEHGLACYLKKHFLEEDIPKYNNRLYPVDIHNYAQGILPMLQFRQFEMANRLVERVVVDMWNERISAVDYRKYRWGRNRINYLRWSQAWMFYALTKYLYSGEVC